MGVFGLGLCVTGSLQNLSDVEILLGGLICLESGLQFLDGPLTQLKFRTHTFGTQDTVHLNPVRTFNYWE